MEATTLSRSGGGVTEVDDDAAAAAASAIIIRVVHSTLDEFRIPRAGNNGIKKGNNNTIGHSCWQQ